MDDDKIKQLFAAYEPELTSDNQFMERLQRKMQAVELIKEKTAEIRRKNRWAVKIAALTGFITGATFTLCFPYLSELLVNIAAASSVMASYAASYGDITIWIAIALATSTLSFTAYDLTLFATSKSKG